MPDYQCYPLWFILGSAFENVSPSDLPISSDLKIKISNWQKTYDDTLNLSDPNASGFKSEHEAIKFDNEGLNIWKQMLIELQELYEVYYYSIKDQMLYENLKP